MPIDDTPQPGFFAEKSITFEAWDGSTWTAELENVNAVFFLDERVNTPNPRFILRPSGVAGAIDPQPGELRDEYIRYRALDGKKWAARIHAHIDGDGAAYEFEHFVERGEKLVSDYRDSTIDFRGAGKSRWTAELRERWFAEPPEAGIFTVGILFHVKRLG